VLFATFAMLQHELTGAPAAVAYSPVANRVDARFENVVGVFTHSSWLIVPVHGARTFAELLSRTSAAVWQRLALQSVPVDVINNALGAPFNADPPRVIFSLFNTPIPALTLPGLSPATLVDVELGGARADQSWLLSAHDDGLHLQVEYATDLFADTTIATWGERYLAILRTALTDPESPLR
jgi:non-ribosomal peptide synthetase component F